MTSASTRHPVILGVDGREPGLLATVWAADEAARRGLPLGLIHAVTVALHDLDGLEGRLHQRLRRNGREVLDQAAVLVGERHPGLEVAGTLVEGSPAKVLCRASAEASFVVLGSRGLSRTEEYLSAYSVTVPVAAQAACPVVVVRAPEHTTQDQPYLVVGVDGSPSSAAAVDCAFDLAARRGAALRAVWVWPSQLIAHVDEATALQTLRRLLAETTAGHGAAYPDVEVTHEVVRGHPVEELAEASRHALAVVVGRRGRGGFTGMRLGSVPHGLLHRARCPVITVPRPGA
ncbi:universal stress protein [Kitasatospora paranensis]|uniref:Universal stress protein n=1 Tax=Kitasatospora paranensis TaxID=258053 RepID=A0ABW2FNX1_9ACTN